VCTTTVSDRGTSLVDGSAGGEDFSLATSEDFPLAMREDLELATREDLELATPEDFFMATDNVEAVPSLRRPRRITPSNGLGAPGFGGRSSPVL